MAPRTEVPPGATFAFDVGLRTLNEQLRRIDALDTKAGVLLAVDGVLVGLLLARESLLLDGPRPFVLSAAVTLMSSIFAALVAFATRRYRGGPALGTVARMISRDEAWLKWRYLGSLADDVRMNERKLDRKALFVSLSVASLMAAVVLTTGYLSFSLWFNSL